MEKSYFEQREQNTLEKLKLVKADLPAICNEFFIGIESYTSALTRLNYALDLRIFFDFLHKEIVSFVNKPIKTIDYTDLELVESMHIEMFLSSNLICLGLFPVKSISDSDNK